MCVSPIPDDIKHLMVLHPVHQELEFISLDVTERGSLLHKHVEFLHTLDTSVEKLRLEAFLAHDVGKDFTFLLAVISVLDLVVDIAD